MDSQRIYDITDELRMLARHEPRWKPLLHRAARALEENLPADLKKVAKGRYGGRLAPPFTRPNPIQRRPERVDQSSLL